MKKIVPYIIYVITAVAVWSCNKTQPIDPKIEAANEFRAAFEPAKTQPNDITTWFNGQFIGIAQETGNPLINVLDSANNVIILADTLEQYGEAANITNVRKLKNEALNVKKIYTN